MKETTLITTIQVTRVIHGSCGVNYPTKIFARQIAEAIREECNPDDILIESVQVFENDEDYVKKSEAVES